MPEKSLLPFILLGTGILWSVLFEWMRQRRRRRQEPATAAPEGQHLTLIGMAGLLIFMFAAAVAAYLKWFPS